MTPLGTVHQQILDGLGSILSFLYDAIPNYGVAIILLTLGIRVLLLPLGIKQIRSMQAMQALQPKVKALQQKYRGNRQKLNEETMKLYREAGVNPLGGCLPLIAQFPVLIALFMVLQFPNGLTHIPRGSELERAINTQRTTFAGMNLLCNAMQAGSVVEIPENRIPPTRREGAPTRLNCGQGIPVRIPYYLLALAMIGTTYYQQRQMQRANPTAAQQQQALTRVLPLVFGFWGFFFPAGLVLYWTTTNLVQIGQQHFMLPRERAEDRAGAAARAPRPASGDGARRKAPASDGAKGGGSTGPARSGGRQEPLPAGPGKDSQAGRDGGRATGGGRGGRDRKKRRKR